MKDETWAWGANVGVLFETDLGGRGDVVGSFNNAGSLFLAAHYNWKS